MKHDTPEELKRALDKKEEALARQRRRSARLKAHLDVRTQAMVKLWGHLDDIRRDLDRVVTREGPHDNWPGVVRDVRKLVTEYITLKSALSRESVRAALFEEKLREAREQAPGLFRWLWRWLKTRRRA